MNYEQLDAIADAYIPLLGILLLASIVKALIIKDYQTTARIMQQTLIALMLVYGLMFLDKALNIWPLLSWDYSTHTALSVVLIMILLDYFDASTTIRSSLVLSLLAYAILMLYQQYHTIADILSTVIVIVPIMYAAIRLTKKEKKAGNGE